MAYVLRGRTCQPSDGQLMIASRPMTVVFGLGTRLCVHMRTKLENGVLRNVTQPGSAVNSFIDQDKFEDAESCRVPHSDKHPFRGKVTPN